jgi:methyl-accepting chemotaxis protein
MSLSRKLAISCGAIVALVVALSYCCLNAVHTLSGILDKAANVAARKMDLVAEIQTGVQEMEDHAKKTQLVHAVHKLESGGAGCSSCHAIDPPEADRHGFEVAGAKVLEKIAAVRPLIAEPTGRAVLDAVETGVRSWVESYRDYLKKFAENDFSAAHDVITARMLPVLESVDRSTALLWDEERTFFAHSNSQAQVTAERSQWVAVGLVVLGGIIVTGILLGVWHTSSRLRQLAADLGQQAHLVAGAAERVSNSSNSVAEGASEQANSLEEVSVSSSDINVTAQKNAENAKTSAQVSTEVGRDLTDANRRLEQLMAAMRDIQSASGKVSNIMKVIDEIAFQTNILALNAAVEAARAGESGLGFAVVAGEVRTLAQRSAQAAQETAALIEESMAASENGMARLGRVTEAFRGLSRSAETVTKLAGDVQTGSLDQVHRVEGIAERIAHMHQVTQRATTGALESAQAGEELKSQAQDLRAIVSRLAGIV